MNLKNGIIVSHVIQRQYSINNCASKIKTNPVCSVYGPAISLYLWEKEMFLCRITLFSVKCDKYHFGYCCCLNVPFSCYMLFSIGFLELGVLLGGSIDVSEITKMFRWKKNQHNRLAWHFCCNLFLEGLTFFWAKVAEQFVLNVSALRKPTLFLFQYICT